MNEPVNHGESSVAPTSPDVFRRRRMLAFVVGLAFIMTIVLVVQSVQSSSKPNVAESTVSSSLATATSLPLATPATLVVADSTTPTTVEATRSPIVSIYGDSLAAGFGAVLKSDLDQQSVTAFLATKGSSGLSQPGFFDWPNHLDVWVPRENADVVVIGLGANDCQDVSVDGVSYSVDEPEWSIEYARRVTELIDLVTVQGRSLIWVGTPDTNAKKFRANLAILRTATQQAVEASRSAEVDVVYLDTWTMFLGLDGGYSEYVIDRANGEKKKSRDSDGFHLSLAGNKILAAAIAQEIQAALDRRLAE